MDDRLIDCHTELKRLRDLQYESDFNDNIDQDIENKQLIRLHVPIRTNKDVVFTIYDSDEDVVGQELNLKTGRYYYLDVTKPHSVSNNSNIDRYHLVVDCFVNDDLKAIL